MRLKPPSPGFSLALLILSVVGLILGSHFYFGALSDECDLAFPRLIHQNPINPLAIFPFAMLSVSAENKAIESYIWSVLLIGFLAAIFWLMLTLGLLIRQNKTRSHKIAFFLSLALFLLLADVQRIYLGNGYLNGYFDTAQMQLFLFIAVLFWLLLLIVSLIRLIYFLGGGASVPLMDNPDQIRIPLAPEGSPDWKIFQTDIECPICSYNLRGLVNPRCPECGYPFQWAEMRPIANPWLSRVFEFTSKRIFRSFLFTVAQSLLAPRFFTRLTASHPLRKSRLAVYVLVLNLILIILQFNTPMALWAYYSLNSTSPRVPLLQVFNYYAYSYLANAFLCPFIVFSWILYSSLSIFLIRQTARKAKIKPWHMVRCAIYSASPMLPLSIIALWAMFLIDSHDKMYVDMWVIPIIAAFLAWPMINLALAAKHYLRIPRPLFTTLTLQFIFVLGAWWLFQLYKIIVVNI